MQQAAVCKTDIRGKYMKMITRFPSSAEGLLDQTDFRAFYRDEPFDPDKAAHILDTLRRHAGQNISAPAQRSGSCVTVDSYIGGGAHWSYAEAPGSACLPAAAISIKRMQDVINKR